MRSLLVISILAISYIGCTSEKKSGHVTRDGNKTNIEYQKEEIKKTLIDMWDAIENEDIERYASYIHPDFTQFGETASRLNIGKENEVNGVKDWIESSKGIHTEMEEPRVSISGDVAWITYYWRDRGITDGKPFSSRGKSTRVFVKENEVWLCIHGHYTLLPMDE